MGLDRDDTDRETIGSDFKHRPAHVVMSHVAVLGGGAVGSLIAHELLALGHTVRLLDSSPAVLRENQDRSPALQTIRFDGTDPGAFASALEACELAVNALPGHLGHRSLKAIIETGTDCVDLAFTPEDPRTLDPAARASEATVVVDAGVAPGLSNLLAARLLDELGARKIAGLDIFVGGLPVRRTLPWEYAAPFSISDVIEEYTRPARFKRGGRVVEVPALTGRRPLEVEGVGTLEACLTDGLRTLLDLPLAEMAEYTLRYPGHAARVELLREAGLFSTAPVRTRAGEVSPRELTLELLRDQWRLEPGEPEFTHLRVEATTKLGETVGWTVHDTGLEGWTSMARTTGLTAVAFADLILDGTLTRPGVHPPEAFGDLPGVFDNLTRHLQVSGVDIQPILV